MEHEPGCDQRHAPRQACNQALKPQDERVAGSPPGPAQQHESISPANYCIKCGGANGAAARYCKHCGWQLASSRLDRISGIAFLLNEAQSDAVGEIIGDRARSRLIAHYLGELKALVVPARAAPVAPPSTSPVAPAAAPVARHPIRNISLPAPTVPTPVRGEHITPPPAAPARVPVAPSRPRKPPRPPRDWSWLAEQQANLFLFAGAFLVVVAALIFVAYSGETVSAGLQMSMLAGFTLAFLAAGVVCLRIPRVVAAGHVFFAVGAILVPLNFVAAYTIMTDEEIDPNAVWFAGSLTSAMLYTAVATLGMGRVYAFASGIALTSAAAAATAIADVPIEWTPVAFLIQAVLMSAGTLAGPKVMRRQIGRVWTVQAHVIAQAAILAAIVMALVAAPDEARLQVANRWFLPAAFVGALTYASVVAVSAREDIAGAGVVVALGGAFVTVVYALSLPAEQYAIAFAALALLLAILLPTIEAEAVRRRVPGGLSQFAHLSAIAATLAAAGVAFTFAAASRSEDASRYVVPETHWFATPAFALLLAFYLLDAFGRRQRLGVTGSALALVGLGASFVYGLSASAEYYALALTGAAIAMVAFACWILPLISERLTPVDIDQDTRVLAQTALAFGISAAIYAALVSSGGEIMYTPQSPWFLLCAFGSAVVAYAIYLTLPMTVARWYDALAPSGLALALTGAATSVVYGLDASPEYYAVAFTGSGIALVAALHGALPRIRNNVLLGYVEPSIRILAQAAVVTGVSVAVAAALVASSPERDYNPQSLWFLLYAFGSAAVAYALYLALPMAVTRWHDAPAPYGLALALTGAATSVVYGLDARPEYYAVAFTGAGIVVAAALHAVLPRIRNAVLLRYLEPGAQLFAQAALATGVGVGIGAALTASDNQSTYTPQTPWFLFATFASALAGYLLCAALRRPAAQWQAHLAHLGLCLALVGTCTSVVYGFDAGAEYYSYAFVTGSAALMMVAWIVLPRTRLPATTSPLQNDYLVVAHAGALTAGCVAVGAALAASAEGATYQPDSHWFLPIAFAALAGFYALAFGSRVRPVPGSEPIAPLGFVASVFGVTTGLVYALHASPEYYALAFTVPAIGLGMVARMRRPLAVTGLLPTGWENAAIGFGRIAVSVGVAVAVIAAIVAESGKSTYQPNTHAFLPLAFLTAAGFLAFDASRRRDWQVSTALLAALGGAGVSTVYALDAGVQYYGVAFACVGILYGFGGRIWSPAWLDARARDALASIAVTTAWLAFEGVYADYEKIGAGVHLSAAVFYGMAALVTPRERALSEIIDGALPAPVAVGWLYASGLVTTIGYVLLLRGLPAGEEAAANWFAVPLLALALGFLFLGATARFWRGEFRIHLYVMALLLSVGSLSAAPDAAMLATLLTVFIGAFLAVSVWENAPAFAIPSVVYGFIAVVAWQQRLDAPQYVIPLLYSSVAACLYLPGFALRGVAPRWSSAMRACGAAYGLVAPAAGYGSLAWGTEKQLYEGTRFEESALYQWSTAAVALVGVLATIEASIARRGWVVVLGSAVLTVSLLLEIGRFRPENVQAYTAVIGVYVLLLGLLGLWKFRLIPEFEDTAPAVEALGALIIMIPSAREAWQGGWQYLAILLVESALFFAISVTLRRRVLLATALLAIVLIAGRALFDAINALPNWIVILIAGLALLGIGTAILLGRDRWARWEHTLMSWWDHTGGGPLQHA